MPQQRMAGYTPLKARPRHDDAAPSAVQSAPEPAAGSEPAAAPPSATASPSGAVGVVPLERRQRMAGYTPLKGAVAPAPSPQQAAGVPWEPAAGQEAERSPAAAEPTPRTRQRMAGYTPLKPRAVPTEAATAVTPPAAAAAPEDAPAQPPAPETAAEPVQPAAPAEAQTVQPAAQKRQGAAAVPASEAVQAEASPAASPARRGRRLLWTVAGAVVVGLALVLAARGLRTLEPVQGFIDRYDGHTSLPESAPVGIPAWLGWQHFLNMFLMVLIIRTGLQIRAEQRPPAHFTPRRDSLFSARGNTPKKYSLTVWVHQALDGLWVLNGAVFVVLLFATGQWMRIIPTDPSVVQHALSAGLQYLSLDWPAEDGWVHYNALQMLSYTLVVFVAAPLAALTGWRMSSWFPAQNAALTRLFPMEAARRLHFPVMVFFVGFIVVHVFLVAFTGLLGNLNHMYTSRDAVDVWGLVVFALSVAVTAAAWFLLKPQVVAPVAQRFGTVGR